MKAIEHLLFPTDFSACSRHAAETAFYFARELGAVLHLFHAALLHDGDPARDSRLLRAMARDVSEAPMNQALQACSDENRDRVEIRTDTARGIVASRAILDGAQSVGAGLIVMGSHGRRGMEHWLWGSVTEEVIAEAACPVVVVKEAWQGHPGIDLSEVLLPLDWERHGLDALAAALDWAQRFGARLHVLHVLESGVSDTASAKRTLARHIESGLAGRERPVPVRLHVKRGQPRREILKFTAEHKPGLVILHHRHAGPDESGAGILNDLARETVPPILVLSGS